MSFDGVEDPRSVDRRDAATRFGATRGTSRELEDALDEADEHVAGERTLLSGSSAWAASAKSRFR